MKEKGSKYNESHAHQRMGTILNLEKREYMTGPDHIPDLSPQQRDRCNTWPRKQPDSCYSSSSEEGERYGYTQHSPMSQGSGLSSPRSHAPGLALVSEEGDSDGDEGYSTRGQDNY